MTIQEILTQYKFNNVGQFRAIATSLGYRQEYNKGNLRFVGDNDDFRISVEKIRSYTNREPDVQAESASMERVCQFFDRDKALSFDYKTILSKEGVDIINWGDLKADSKDRFTVIDHSKKICYTGKELYDYAMQNGYMLDGTGTKLEQGVLSEMREIKGKPAKIRLTENGVSVFYRKETLVIPDKLLGKKLSDKQKQDLLAGNVIVLPTKKGDMLIQVDRDLNSVIVRSEKEISIPAQIGGYELTPADKFLLANGHSLDNKLLHTPEEGYIIANISLSEDKRGIVFTNIQSISKAKAQELLQSKDKEYLNNKLKEMQQSGRIGINELKKDKRYEQLISNHFSSEYKEYLSYLKDENPDKDYNYDLEGRIRLKSGEILEKEGVLAKGATEQELKEEGFKVELLREKPQEEAPEKDIISNRDLEQELKEAMTRNDYEKISNLQKEGYQPSAEIILGLGKDIHINEKQAAVIETLFGIKPEISLSEETKKEDVVVEEVVETILPEVKSSTPERDVEFLSAIQGGNFDKITEMKEQGYLPSKQLLQSLNGTVPDNSIIAIHKIFSLRAPANTLGDIKLAREVSNSNNKSITQPLANAVNRAFSDL